MKRHTCIICGRKRNEHYMINVFANSWACEKNDFKFILPPCYVDSEIRIAKQIILDLKKLKKINIRHIVGGK